MAPEERVFVATQDYFDSLTKGECNMTRTADCICTVMRMLSRVLDTEANPDREQFNRFKRAVDGWMEFNRWKPHSEWIDEIMPGILAEMEKDETEEKAMCEQIEKFLASHNPMAEGGVTFVGPFSITQRVRFAKLASDYRPA